MSVILNDKKIISVDTRSAAFTYGIFHRAVYIHMAFIKLEKDQPVIDMVVFAHGKIYNYHSRKNLASGVLYNIYNLMFLKGYVRDQNVAKRIIINLIKNDNSV